MRGRGVRDISVVVLLHIYNGAFISFAVQASYFYIFTAP